MTGREPARRVTGSAEAVVTATGREQPQRVPRHHESEESTVCEAGGLRRLASLMENKGDAEHAEKMLPLVESGEDDGETSGTRGEGLGGCVWGPGGP